MAVFKWDDSVSIGIATIDEQHKSLFDLINTLSEAIENGDSSEVVGSVVFKLINYVTEHFGEEERLMLSWNYPGLPEHRKEHDLFVSQLEKIQVNFIKGEDMGKSVLDFLVEWLVCHIKGTDQGYSRYIHERQ